MAKPPLNSTTGQKSYRYFGPVTPLDIAGDEPRMLFPGKSYDGLPEDHHIVRNLIERKLLAAEAGTADGSSAPLIEEGA